MLTMVGLNIVPIMVLNFFGLSGPNDSIDTPSVLVALITLGAMVGTNIWGKGQLRLYSVIIGMAVGYIAAYVLGVLTDSEVRRLIDSPLVALPDLSHLGWTFDIRLFVPIAVATLASTLEIHSDSDHVPEGQRCRVGQARSCQHRARHIRRRTGAPSWEASWAAWGNPFMRRAWASRSQAG